MKKDDSAITGVVVHGRHLQTAGWTDIMWGRPPDLMGELPMAVHVAALENARVMVLGTGVVGPSGKVESQVTMEYLFDNFDALREFTVFSNADIQALRRRIHDILRLDRISQNTREEVVEAGRIVAAHGATRMILVSAPTHISRCLRDALARLPNCVETSMLARNLWAVASDIPYLGTSADDVVIVEPPHRGDSDDDANLRYFVHRTLDEFRRAPGENALLVELAAVLERFTAHGD